MSVQKKYNRDFFKKWSHDMAYILGFLYADGNIVETKRGNHYVAFYTADRPLLMDMRTCMQSMHKVARTPAGSAYRIQVGSKEWFHDLERLGMTPDKTKRMQLPCIPEEFFGGFVRGYFDGDGNVWVGFVHKSRRTPLRTIQVAFTSGSDGYLRSLQNALKARGIVGGSMYASKTRNYSRLAYSVRDALKIYRIMYNVPHKLYLKRKRSVFEQFMRLRA